MTTTPNWKRGGTRAISWRSSSADFGKGVLGGGERQRRRRRRAGTTSTEKTSRRSRSSRRSARGSHRCRCPRLARSADRRRRPRRGRAGRIRRGQNDHGRCKDDGNGTGDASVTTTPTIDYHNTTTRHAQSHHNITFNKKHIICLIFCN